MNGIKKQIIDPIPSSMQLQHETGYIHNEEHGYEQEVWIIESLLKSNVKRAFKSEHDRFIFKLLQGCEYKKLSSQQWDRWEEMAIILGVNANECIDYELGILKAERRMTHISFINQQIQWRELQVRNSCEELHFLAWMYSMLRLRPERWLLRPSVRDVGS